MSRVGAEVLLSVRGLVHHFPGRPAKSGRSGRTLQAVRGVDFDLREGECLALVGESGSGKSTLARCLLRLVEPAEGKVLYRERDVLSMGREELRGFRRQVQMVFQDPFGSLNPRIRAGSMIEEVLQVHGDHLSRQDRKARAAEIIEQVGLHRSQVSRFPHEFSGGQRQRLGIARALAVAPELLVLDEPVSSLDLSVQAQILNLLADLQARLGLTMLLIAHDLAVVRQVADRGMVMFGGSIVETAPVPQLLEEPIHPCTRGLVAAASPGYSVGTGRGPWDPLPGDPPDPREDVYGCIFHRQCPHPEKDEECVGGAPHLTPLGTGGRVACWKEIRGAGGA